MTEFDECSGEMPGVDALAADMGFAAVGEVGDSQRIVGTGPSPPCGGGVVALLHNVLASLSTRPAVKLRPPEVGGPMRAVVQRVSGAAVTIEGETAGRIGRGLCVLVGVTHTDTLDDANWLASKLWGLRIFPDENGAMNVAACDIGAEMLIVSQFTLYGDVAKGRRPSFVGAAPGDVAEPLVEAVAEALRDQGATVATGRFGADMEVSLVNEGPVTLIVERRSP